MLCDGLRNLYAVDCSGEYLRVASSFAGRVKAACIDAFVFGVRLMRMGEEVGSTPVRRASFMAYPLIFLSKAGMASLIASTA